jgi:Protein kinase domain
MRTESATPTSGDRVGQYELVSLLGSGGMGHVFLARDTRLQRNVALKLLRAPAGEDGSAAGRFLREARAVASLEHPNICTLYEAGTADGREYLAMQYVEGETLAARLRRGEVPHDVALRVAVDLTTALAYAHSKGVLHRDLKPQNVMLTPEGSVKLLDFGLAKTSPVFDAAAMQNETEAVLTRDGTVIGTLEYMSPEQMAGRNADERSDVFSLGLVIYELVAHRHPYRRETPALTMSAILTQPYPPIAGTRQPSAPTLNPILEKALAVESGERYANAADLLADLKWAQAGGHGDAPRPAAHPPRSTRRAGWIGAGIAAAIVVAAAISAPIVTRGRPPLQSPVKPPASIERSMTYWLDVRAGDDGAGAAPYRSLGDESLGDGAKVRFNVVSPGPGFLYLLDQEGNDDRTPLALVYPISTEVASASNGDATGWYGFSGTGGVDHLWLVWSSTPVPDLDALRPLVNPRDLGRITDPQRSAAIRAWLESAAGRSVRETRDTKPFQVTVAYDGPLVVRHVALRHSARSSW